MSEIAVGDRVSWLQHKSWSGGTDETMTGTVVFITSASMPAWTVVDAGGRPRFRVPLHKLTKLATQEPSLAP